MCLFLFSELMIFLRLIAKKGEQKDKTAADDKDKNEK